MIDANTYYLNQELKEQEDFINWVERNEDDIFTAYTEGLTFFDIPDEYIQQMYESAMQEDEEWLGRKIL